MNGFKEYFTEFNSRIKSEYKMMALNNLLKYIRREHKLETRKFSLIIKQLMVQISQSNSSSTFLPIAKEIISILHVLIHLIFF